MQTNTPTTTGYAPVNGLHMYYEIHGSGQPLVLIHGGGSTLHTTFGRVLPLLAQANQVIGVELQAHGHTADRDTPETFEQDADDVAALLAHLGIAQVALFGFSNGGNTAMQVAIRHPQRVSKLVVASAFYQHAGILPMFWNFLKDAHLGHMPQVYKDAYLAINPGNQAGLQAMHDRDLQRMRTFTDWPDTYLQSIQAPTLLVCGDKDMMLPEHTVHMHRLIAGSRLAILPGNHGSYMGEVMTTQVNEAQLIGFVAMVNEFLAG